jgi:probable O-glycosylation ligase (exosortase A-associated)
LLGALVFVLWLVKEEKTLPRPMGLFLLVVAFWCWIDVTTVFALAPEAAMEKWQRTVKLIGFSILTAQMTCSRARLEGFVWIMVLCIGWSAVPGAIKTLVSGGGGETVIGAPGSFLEDRVMFAIALPEAIPLALFLSHQSTLLPLTRMLRLGLQGVVLSCIVAMIGTFARTALFSGGAILPFFLAKAKRKVWMGAGIAAFVLLDIAIAPASWFERMGTIETYEQEKSAESRIEAWRWSWQFALEHPILGGGFRSSTLYHPKDNSKYTWMEAHNILFEVMADHGFVGLALICAILFGAYRTCGVAARRARESAELEWAVDLAAMTQISIVAVVVGGMFASVATDGFVWDVVVIAIGVRNVVERALGAEEPQSARRPAHAAQHVRAAARLAGPPA